MAEVLGHQPARQRAGGQQHRPRHRAQGVGGHQLFRPRDRGDDRLTRGLEEDRERYQDVIRDLSEFEEAEGGTETVSTTEEVHELDAIPETTVA